VRRLEGADFGDRDPFRLLAQESEAVRSNMGSQTLAAIGENFDGRPGFILLAATGNTPENPDGASEALLDHGCQVLGRDMRASG
jgi:CDP-diacylglycerol pyrophosphatase